MNIKIKINKINFEDAKRFDCFINFILNCENKKLLFEGSILEIAFFYFAVENVGSKKTKRSATLKVIFLALIFVLKMFYFSIL